MLANNKRKISKRYLNVYGICKSKNQKDFTGLSFVQKNMTVMTHWPIGLRHLKNKVGYCK
jgi:hypothetical protein